MELWKGGGQRQPRQSIQSGDARGQPLHHRHELLDKCVDLLQGQFQIAQPWNTLIKMTKKNTYLIQLVIAQANKSMHSFLGSSFPSVLIGMAI